MAERKIISAAIEPEANERIEKLAEKLGLSKSNLIANMLESFLPTAEELTREDILDGAEDPDLQPTREPVAPAAKRKAGAKADDHEAEDGEPEHAEDGEAEEEESGEAAEDGNEDGDEEEVTGDEEEEEAAPAPVKKRPAKKSKGKAKKGKK